MLSFKPIYSLSSLTFIKRLFSSSLLSAIKVVSSAYLRLLIFLPAILIPAGKNINNLWYADDTTVMAESEKELKSLLMWMKEESKKAGLKLSIKITKIMAFSPITSWQIDGEKNGNSDRLYFWVAPKSLQIVTAAMKLKDAYSFEEKL